MSIGMHVCLLRWMSRESRDARPGLTRRQISVTFVFSLSLSLSLYLSVSLAHTRARSSSLISEEVTGLKMNLRSPIKDISRRFYHGSNSNLASRLCGGLLDFG